MDPPKLSSTSSMDLPKLSGTTSMDPLKLSGTISMDPLELSGTISMDLPNCSNNNPHGWTTKKTKRSDQKTVQ